MRGLSFEPGSEHPRGSALVLALIAIVFLAILSTAMTDLAISGSNVAIDTQARYQALLLAEAGIAAAVKEVNFNKDFSADGTVGNAAEQWGTSGSFTAVRTDLGGGLFSIVSTGTIANRPIAGDITTVSRAIENIYRVASAQGKFNSGAFGKAMLILNGRPETDSYDSGIGTTYQDQVAGGGGIGPYRASPAGGMGNVGSNGDVSVVGNVSVFGNITPGPGKSVLINGGALTITGSTASNPTAIRLPDVTYSPPTGLLAVPDALPVLAAGEYRFDQWSSQNVTVSGNVVVYLEGDFTQNGQKSITISPGGSLVIYQKQGTFTLNGGGVVNNNSIPNKFQLVSASTSLVKLNGTSDFFGTVYAPAAPVTIGGTNATFGAVIGNTVDIQGTGDFHWDMSASSPGLVVTVMPLTSREVLPP